MKLALPSKRVGWLAAAALVVAVAKWADGDTDAPLAAQARDRTSSGGESAVARREAAPPPAGPVAHGLDLSRLRRQASKAENDAFAQRNWDPPAPKISARLLRQAAAEAPPPPQPQAPPLPFTYIGMLEGDGTVTVFLATAAKDHAVKTGEVIDGLYRLDEATPERIVLTYLPLGQQQSLSIGTP